MSGREQYPEEPSDFIEDGYLVREVKLVGDFSSGVQIVETDVPEAPIEARRQLLPLFDGTVIMVPFEQVAQQIQGPAEIRDENGTLLVDAKGVVQFYGHGV